MAAQYCNCRSCISNYITPGMSTLKITGLTKSFGNKRILKNIDLEINTGEIFGIFGRNGSGKSTLFSILIGLLKAESVEISIDGTRISPQQIIPEKRIGCLPQQSCLPKGIRVRDCIPLFYTGGEQQDKIFYSKGVSRFENNKIGSLSQGELRYLEILLVGNLGHPFLILDEPFSMIEPLYRDYIRDFLLGQKEKKGIILTDHYYEDVLKISDKQYILKDAAINEIQDKKDLIAHQYLTEQH